MTQINWQYQVNNRSGGYVVTNTDWNDFAGNFRAFVDQTTGSSGTTDNVALPIGIDLANHKVFISDPTSATACAPEAANNTASAQFQVSSNAEDATIALTAAHDTEATSSVIQLRKADGTQASPALVDDDAVLGKIMFQGYDGNSWANGAQIRAQIDGTPADGDMPTEMIFMVTPDGGSETPATAVTISPDKKVTFAGATQHNSTVTVGVDDTGYDVIFYGATASNGYAWWDEDTDSFIVGPAGHLAFGETSPSWPVEFATDDDLTSFTGTGKGGVCITNSQYDADDFTALDFGYTGSDNPIGRVACKVTGAGSELHFGTSNNYSNGITNGSVKITSAGYLQLGDGTDNTLDANINFPLRFDGNGYTAGIGLGGSGHGIWIGHNSSSRAIIFTPDETERCRISGASGYWYQGTTGGSDFPGTDGFTSIKAGDRVALAFYRQNSTSTTDLVYGLSDHSSTGTKHFQIECDGDVQNTYGNYTTLSDERLKENFATPRDYYEDLRKLEVKNFNFCKAVKVEYDENDAGEIDPDTKKVSLVDTDPASRKKLLGLVAQEAEKIFPSLVKTGEDGYKSVSLTLLVPMLLQMCQKMADKIEALEGG